MKAVLIGATGLIGRELLNLLLNDERYTRVLVVSRKPLESHDKLEQHQFPLDSLEDKKHLVIGDHYYCALGTTIKQAGTQEYFYRVDYTYVYEFAKIAKHNLAERFLLVSSQGANSASSLFYTRVKGEVENAVSALNFPSLSIFRPSLLLGKRNKFRLGEQVGKLFVRLVSFLLPPRYRAIKAVTVAKAMINAAFGQAEKTRIYESHEIKKLSLANNDSE